jgi:hypothetical protein
MCPLIWWQASRVARSLSSPSPAVSHRTTPGPIIRIAPNHVHFLDPDFFDELYSMKHPRHMKLAHLRDRFNTPTSIGDTPDADEHDQHRALLAPLFSRQRVAELTGYVQTRADKLCANVLRAAAAGPAVRLDAAWSTYATDNVLWYTLSLAYDFLDYPDFKSPFTEATGKLLWSIHWLTHFPGLMKLFNAIPHEYLEKLSPDIGAIFGFQRVCFSPRSVDPSGGFKTLRVRP